MEKTALVYRYEMIQTAVRTVATDKIENLRFLRKKMKKLDYNLSCISSNVFKLRSKINTHMRLFNE